MKIAVYCSAKDRIPEEYLALGDVLGKWIAEAGHTLVYGGATGGLMTRVSNAAKVAGGEVVGVIPQRIIQAKRMASNTEQPSAWDRSPLPGRWASPSDACRIGRAAERCTIIPKGVVIALLLSVPSASPIGQ